MKFKSIFVACSMSMGLVIGMFSALYLTLVNVGIEFLWHTLPHQLNLPGFYPLIIGLLGGLIIGLGQKYWAGYPHTLEETLTEFRQTGSVDYHDHRLLRTFLASILILIFGASLGPEAALSGLLGGLITWTGEQMKLVIAKKEELIELGLGAMMAAIFRAPLIELDAINLSGSFKSKLRKRIVYTLTTIAGVLGFIIIRKLFPEESPLGLRFPEINWDLEAIWMIIPAIAIGMLFGFYFNYSEKVINHLFSKISNPLILALTAGLAIGLLGMVSTKFLYSGENAILPLSKNYLSESIAFLLALAFGKTLLTHLCFICGWRGGKIFPAIFTSAALGFALVKFFPHMPGLIASIVIAASVTTIIPKPILVATLLLFLLPVQFIPAIVAVCFLVSAILKKIPHK